MAGDVSPVAMLNSQADVFEHTGWMVGLAVDVAGPFTLLGTGAVGLRSEGEEHVKEVGGFKAGSAHHLEVLLPEDGCDILSHHLQGSALEVG